jgi:hypothetical protein
LSGIDVAFSTLRSEGRFRALIVGVPSTHTTFSDPRRALIAEHNAEPEFKQAMGWQERSMSHLRLGGASDGVAGAFDGGT